MTGPTRFLLHGTIWTIAAYGLGLLLRLGTNIIMARLLAPELFGVMSIVYTLWTGVELMTDVGIGQNIVHNKNSENPEFYNTAWSLNLVRNTILWLVCIAAALPAAHLYQLPILASVIPITMLGLVIQGFSSVARSLLQKRMQIAKINLFDLTVSFISSAAYVLFAYIYPTIWALVLGNLINSLVTALGTYLLIPGLRQKFYVSKPYALEILHFGKWLFLSQLVYYLSINFDRLYFAKIVPLELFGIYGI